MCVMNCVSVLVNDYINMRVIAVMYSVSVLVSVHVINNRVNAEYPGMGTRERKQ